MTSYNKYKYSGIDWLGEIPIHWDVKQLSQVAYEHFLSNKDVHHQNLLSLSYGNIVRKPIDSTKGLLPASFDTYQIVEKGNIILRLTDLQNDHRSLRVGLVKEEGIITSAYVCLGIIDEKKIMPDYLYSLLHTYDIWKLFYSMGGGVRQTLNWNELKKISVIVPPLPEQEKMMALLEGKNQLINSYLEKAKKEIDLIKEYINTLIYSIDSTSPIKVEKWENCFPSNWNLVSGRALFEELSIKGVSNARFLAVTQDRGLIYKDVDGINYVTASKKETQKHVSEGQFVISLRSFEGGIEYSNLNGLISPAYVVIKLKQQFDSYPLRMYYRFLFKSSPFVSKLNHISDSLRDGKSIKFSDIKGLQFPIPEEHRLNEIVRYVQLYDAKKDAFVAQKNYLYEYKQRLISDVVTGAIYVQN